MAVEQMNSDLALLEIRPSFGLLLDTHRQHCLRDAALRLFVAPLPKTQLTEVQEIVLTALERLRGAVPRASSDLGQDVHTMAGACHGAWILTAALSLPEAALSLPPAAMVGRRLIDEAAFLLSALCLEGPSALRPALLPCIGLLVQGRGHLLSLHPSLMESLRTGLSSSSRALRARSMDTIVGILSGPAGEHGNDALVRQLAALQPDLLRLVATDVPASVTSSALTALEALADAAAFVPAAALSALLAECLAGTADNSNIARRVLLRLADAEPHALLECLPSGLRRAADLLAGREVGPEELMRSRSEQISLDGLVAALCRQLPQQLRRSVIGLLVSELTNLRGAEVAASSSSVPLLAALLFHFLDGLADGSPVNLGGVTDLGALLAEESHDPEPSLGSLVVFLVVSTLSTRHVSHDGVQTARDSGRSVRSLVAALEELDTEDLSSEHRAALVSKCKHQLRDLRMATKISQSAEQAANEAALGGTAVHSHEPSCAPSPIRVRATEVCAVGIQAVAHQASLAPEIPPFAVYDASCDKWRCSICTEAGGRNPYAKGMLIHASHVPVRMRAHAKSTVHKQAEQILAGKPQPTQELAKPRLARPSPENTKAGLLHEGKRRRLCGQFFLHDRRICRVGLPDATEVAVLESARPSKNHGKMFLENPRMRSQQSRPALGGA